MTLTEYMERALGSRVAIDSREGVIRTGRLTAIRTHDIKCDGEKVHFPHELILDDDDRDPIPVGQIVGITTSG